MRLQTIIKIFLIVAVLLAAPTLSTTGNAEFDLDEIKEYVQFKRRTALPNIDMDSLEGLLEPGECIGATIEERNWSFFICR